MIGPVSEVGKTMLSSLQGAMAKGMPVDQAIQYVKSQAATGVAPLVDLYALLKQFERLKQPPAQNPQGGNLKEQLTNLESSLVRGPQPAMPAPQAQGLASLNAGSMEEPSFAGGGIVVFSQGGQSEAPSRSRHNSTLCLSLTKNSLRQRQRKRRRLKLRKVVLRS